MILYPADRKEFLFLVAKDAGDVLKQFFLPFAVNQTGTALNRKNCLNVDLGVRICHQKKVSAPAIDSL